MAEDQDDSTETKQSGSQTKTHARPSGSRITRKRTKTGCLTCRKRRIKCGEEKPVCANCQKSRRHCDGYNPRVLVRRSLADPTPAGMPASGQHGGSPGTVYGGSPDGQSYGQSGDYMIPAVLAPLQPRPSLDGIAIDEMTGQAYGQYHYTTSPDGTVVTHISPVEAIDPSLHQTSPNTKNSYGLPHGLKNQHGSVDGSHRNGLQIEGIGTGGVTQLLESAAVNLEDNDYYDVFPEEEDEVTTSESLIAKDAPQRSLGVLLHLWKAHSDDLSVRGLDSFLFPGFIDNYRPERVASPLRNEYTAKVFAHFICFTGPMISGAVRLPSISASIFDQNAIPSPRQSLWTYTLPMMALQNQGLLQAMLSLASLQIAKVQGASVTPSLKHYSYSLRRVHHAVRHDRKRHEVSTLAATLLLAFYEVMTADHISWSTHLFGASRLIKEIDFATVTVRLNAMKVSRAAQSRNEPTSSADLSGFFDEPRYHDTNLEDSFIDHFPTLDERLLSNITGRKHNIDQFGFVIGETNSPKQEEGSYSNAELQNIQLLQDLYWWYCKHDIVHSIISGNSLLLKYSTWADCPPRAPVGQPNGAHGTFDHVLLLVGRVCDFMVKDRPRKLRASSSNGDPNRPSGAPPAASQAPFSTDGFGAKDETNGPAGHDTNEKDNDAATSSKSSAPPPFFGLAPSTGGPHLPSAFGSDQDYENPSPTKAEHIELESATVEALEEWAQIRTTFTELAEALGPYYQPLADDERQPEFTPFGQTIFYRSYDIASVWSWYYVGLVVLYRSHPSMPPAATAAVGIAGPQTADYANRVGRIAAGMTPAALTGSLHPSIAGAFTETTLPLFFAGVQYSNQEQRRWTIQRLRAIEDMTGWGSVGLCASGCEVAWIKAHEMGRGPPYEAEYNELTLAYGQPHTEERRVITEGENPLPAERRFIPLNKGSQLLWSFNLFNSNDGLQRHVDQGAARA